jgi:uncharacterized protein (TIRG00374 family)
MLQKKFIQSLIFLVVFIVFVYVIILIKPAETFNVLKKVDEHLIIGSVVLCFLFIFLCASRWKIIIMEIEAKESSRLFNCMGFFSLGYLTGLIVPSRLGYYCKAPLLSKYDNIPLSRGISAVNIETLMDLFFLIIATVISVSVFIFYNSYFTTFLNTILIGLFLAFLCIFTYTLFYSEILLSFCTKIRDGFLTRNDANICICSLKRIFINLVQIIIGTKELLIKRKLLITLLIITFLSQIVNLFAFYYVILSIGKNLPILYLFSILTISTLIGIISMIPGGFGSLDLSLIFFLQNAGFSLSESLNIAILWRFCVIFPMFLVGSIFLLKDKIRGGLLFRTPQ